MEYVVPFTALAELLHEHLAPVYGESRPWTQLPLAMQRDLFNAVRQALLQADARGLLQIFPDDHSQSVIA